MPNEISFEGMLGINEPEETSFISMLGIEVEETPVVDESGKLEGKKDVGGLYTSTSISPLGMWSPDFAKQLGQQGLIPSPSGGWDELGRPLDEMGNPYQSYMDTTNAKKTVIDRLKGMVKAVGEEALATSELAMSLASGMLLYFPSKLYGTMALPFGREVANIAEEEMAKLGYQPYTEKGKLAAELVGRGFEIFLAPAKMADEEISKLSPEAGYLVGFGTELAEFIVTGGLIKGAKAKFKPNLEQGERIVDVKRKLETDTLKAKEEAVSKIPDEAVKSAQKRVLEVEKQRMEIEAAAIQESLDYGKMIKEDLGIVSSKIKKVKELPKKKLVDEQIDKAMRERIKPEEVVEPTIDLDHQTGTPIPPELSTEKSPFRTAAKKTNQMKKAYDRFTEKQISEDPDLFLGKYINDVNRWLEGNDAVDIAKVRDSLSTISSRVDELRYHFTKAEDPVGSFESFRDLVSDAAEWARRADRLKIEPSVDLNMMIPIDQLPKQVMDVARDIKGLRSDRGILVKDVFRNRELFDKTGFWFGKDFKWRYELDDTKAKYHPSKYIRDQYDKIGIGTGKLSDVLDYPALYEAVPRTKDVIITFDKHLKWDGESSPGVIRIWRIGDKKILFHELQHVVNNIVGSKFVGSSVEFEAISGKRGAKLRYFKAPGEMEARLAETRMNMTAAERKSTPPWKTLDSMLIVEKFTTDLRIGKEAGQKLYTGIPADEIIKGAKKLIAYTKQARGMKAFKPKVAVQLLKEEFVRAFVDRSGNIRKQLLDKLGEDGYAAVQKMYLSKGASSLSANLLNQMRKEVYGGLSKHEKTILDNLILADRMVDLGGYKTKKGFKFPKGIEPENSAAYSELFEFLEKLPPDRAAEIRTRAEAYFDWMKKPLKDMLEEGLISEEEFGALSSHNYRRIKLIDVFDKRYQAKIGAKKRTIYDSGVEALAKGRDTDIFEPSSEVMALEVFNRAYGRILNNRANTELLNLAREKPDNPFVRVKQKKGDKIPSGWNRFFTYEKGERKPIYLSPEMSKEWITSNPEMSYRLSQFIRFTSLSPVLRTFATGINWGFAVANLPRDVMHTWFTARIFDSSKKVIVPKGSFPFIGTKTGGWKPVYSPHAPVFGLQIGRDLATVFSDAAGRKGRYDKYMEEGGGMEFLVHQGRILQRGRHLEGNIDKINDFLGYFGETSEVMTRLAIRERVIRRRASEKGISIEEARKNKDITTEATFAARDYMDFGQGGGISKALDNGIPYLNAAIIGTRGLLRAFKDNPVSSTYKLSQFAALTVGIYIAARKQTPKTIEALQGSVDMKNNMCLPLSDDLGFEDEHGQMRYPYLKIPIDPGQKFFKTFFEASTDKWLGYDVDIDRVVDSLKEFSPVGVTELPPSASAALGYATNKDFWLNEDIWRRTDKPFDWPKSKEEYIPGDTPQAYIDLGEVTGLSPERMRFAIEELTTRGTVWSYLVGRGYDELFGGLPKEKKEQHLAMVLSKTPVIKRFFGVTHPYSQYAQVIDKAKEESSIERFVQNRELDRLTEGYLYEGNTDRGEVFKYIRSFRDRDIHERLTERFRFQERIKGLPNRSFWLRLQGLTTEARAKVYVDRMDKMTVEEREEVRVKEMSKVIRAGGVFSDDFRTEVSKLRRE